MAFVRITPTQDKALKALAQAKGVTVSTLIKDACAARRQAILRDMQAAG